MFFPSRIASTGEVTEISKVVSPAKEGIRVSITERSRLIWLNALDMDLRPVASPVLKIAGSRLQIRKVQFLQILYIAQGQPQDSLKGSNQLNLALNLTFDLTFDLTFSVCCVERPLLISQRLFSCVVHLFVLRYLGYSRERNSR